MSDLDKNIEKIAALILAQACLPEEIKSIAEAIVSGTAKKQKERDEQLTRIEKKLDDVLNSF